MIVSEGLDHRRAWVWLLLSCRNVIRLSYLVASSQRPVIPVTDRSRHINDEHNCSIPQCSRIRTSLLRIETSVGTEGIQVRERVSRASALILKS